MTTMNTNDYMKFFEELDDANDEDVRSSPRRISRKRESKKHETDVKLFVRAQEISREFQFTYKAARFEEAWLLDSLVEIAQHQWISDVLRKVKSGKEASVYQCRSGVGLDSPLIAAKIYRPRSLRNLKNDHQYRTGRIDLGEDGKALWKDADVHAVQKRTAYGEQVRHQSWISYEYNTLEELFEAGADVPRPYAMERNAILMDFVGDYSMAAPALSSVTLDLAEAKSLFERTVRNIDIMLSRNRIHGDLSAYNILYWEGDIKLIDFPQVVLPDANPSSWHIFQRDVARICQYFASQGVRRDARKLASDLWISHGHKIHREVDPKYLDPEKPEDRKVWEKQK
jgi:RIO kinase 1